VPPPLESAARTQTDAQVSRSQSQTQLRPFTLLPTLTMEETFTDNVNLQPSSSRQSDFVTQITPGLQVSGNSARASLNGSIALPILVYARTGGENNRVVPQVNLVGSVEALERLFFVEGSVYVTQEYLNPFGARSTSLSNNPDNAYVTKIYRVSPYFKGTTPGGLKYELRNNNIWSNLNSTPLSAEDSYTNEAIARLEQDPLPFGWALELNRTDVKFTGQESQLSELARGRAIAQPDPRYQVSVSAGYEHNRYPFVTYDDLIYGVGGRWHPTDRTNLDAQWEHRFFGSSYQLVFDHRTPQTVITLSASRNLQSYPQLLAQIPPGGIVPLLLDSLFRSRIPDPLQRQQFVQQFIRDRGLPLVLSDPFSLYSQQTYLEERASATLGLIGARNTLFFTGYRLRVEPVTSVAGGSSLPTLFELINNNTQRGGGVVWSHNLSALATLAVSGDYVRTEANAPLTGTTRQGSVRAILSTSISANTSVYAGLRFQSLRSDLSDSSRELAGYAGFTHTFR
jgi:uncharacterized protein (PEP-CTERM system associated)